MRLRNPSTGTVVAVAEDIARRLLASGGWERHESDTPAMADTASATGAGSTRTRRPRKASK